MWTKITDQVPPIGKRVLLKYEYYRGHIEDGTTYEDEARPGQYYYILFDGASLTHDPTEWMEIP